MAVVNNPYVPVFMPVTGYWENGQIFKSERGTLVWMLHSHTGLELSSDNTMRITNTRTNTVIAMNPNDKTCILQTNNGSIMLERNGLIHVTGYDLRNKNDKYSTIDPVNKEIVFVSRESKVPQKVDESGVKTAPNKKFWKMYIDISYNVFSKINPFPSIKPTYQLLTDGTQHWTLNGLNIVYRMDGNLEVILNTEYPTPKKEEIKITLNDGAVRIQTPFIFMTASFGNFPHLYVKKNGLRVYYDGIKYTNRVEAQEGGYNQYGLLTFKRVNEDTKENGGK